jgi:hypothetical protein
MSDVELVAELSPQQATELIRQPETGYAVDPRMVARAFAKRTSFPLVELIMLLKVDIILPRERVLDHSALDHSALERTRPTSIAHDLVPLPFITAEDLLLFKRWSSGQPRPLAMTRRASAATVCVPAW